MLQNRIPKRFREKISVTIMPSSGSIIMRQVIPFSSTDVELLALYPNHPTGHIHHKANSSGSGHATGDHAYLQAVVDSRRRFESSPQRRAGL
jgi:hypothetical protein